MSPQLVGSYSDAASVALAIIVFIFQVARDFRNKTTTSLATILARGAGVAAVPPAMVMNYGAFDPSIICQTQGLRVAIAFGGPSLLYVAAKSLTSN